MSVIATATNTVVGSIPVGSAPFGVAVTPDGSKVYVTNERRTVSVIDTATNTVAAPIPVGIAPPAWRSRRTAARSMSPTLGRDTVSVIATAPTPWSAHPIAVGLRPAGVAVTPDGSKVYVANLATDTVSVIAAATNTVVDSPIPVSNSRPQAFGLFIQAQFAGTPGGQTVTARASPRWRGTTEG